MKSKSALLWAIVQADSGHLVLFDGRAPIYWKQKVAMAEAVRHGLIIPGKKSNSARVCRVEVKQAPAVRLSAKKYKKQYT